MKWWVVMKKQIVIIIALVSIINLFTLYDKVLAEQAISTAGIRFVEGNNHATNYKEKNPPQSRDEMTLPQTGGESSIPYYVIGIGLIGLASLLVMKSHMKNLEGRRN